MPPALKMEQERVSAVGAWTGVAEGRLSAEDRHNFLHTALKGPPQQLSLPRFAGLVTDFAGIARGEATSDVLLSYEL